MRIIGLDIAFCNVGVVSCHWDGKELTLTSCETIVTKPPKKSERVSNTIDNLYRTQAIHSALAETFREVDPHLVALEGQSWPRINPSSSIQMAQAWGAIAPLLTGIPVIATSPQALKQAVWGARDATKEQVHHGCLLMMPNPLWTQQVVDRCVPKKKLQEHCWDALGAVLAALQAPEFPLLAAAGLHRQPLPPELES